jgi:hypothetical protein
MSVSAAENSDRNANVKVKRFRKKITFEIKCGYELVTPSTNSL